MLKERTGKFNMEKSSFQNETSCIKAARHSRTGGFSMIELVIALVILLILSAISLPYIYNYKRLYKSEDQALKVMDLMREASQMALTRRRIIRFEIDLTTNQMLLIDGNTPGPADDTLIKAIPLEPVNEIRMDVIPAGVTRPVPPDYNDAAYVVDTAGHLRGATPVIGNTVWQISFLPNGTALDFADNPVTATLYIWPPRTPGSVTPRNNTEIRAITIFGGSGAVRYWKYDGAAFIPYQ